MKNLLIILCAFLMVGCASVQPRLKTVERLDIDRFMGPWYVIACIPVALEAKAYNEVETYDLLSDGTVNTVLTFNQGSFDGPAKRYNPKGFIVDKVNKSTWAMQFIWPFKAEYLVTYINDDYSQTIIGRNKRDHFWIMARTPQIPDTDYEHLLSELSAQGYDTKKTRKVPQK